MDRLPSYRFYKSRYIKSEWTDLVIISLGMYYILPWLNADPVELEEAMFSNLDVGPLSPRRGVPVRGSLTREGRLKRPSRVRSLTREGR